MNQQYRIERARLRDYSVAILDTVDGIHRAMAYGDLGDAARYADDLKALAASTQSTIARIQKIVHERLQPTPASERSAQ